MHIQATYLFSLTITWLSKIFKINIICIISEDDDLSVWMFAMIAIGCVFVVFVAVSIYLIWWVIHAVPDWGCILVHTEISVWDTETVLVIWYLLFHRLSIFKSMLKYFIYGVCSYDFFSKKGKFKLWHDISVGIWNWKCIIV